MWRFALAVLGGIVFLIVISWDHIVRMVMDFVSFLFVAVPTTAILCVVGYAAFRLIRGAKLERLLHESIAAYKLELIAADERGEAWRKRREEEAAREEAERQEAIQRLFRRHDEDNR